jgi:hypothetical protein
MTLRDLLFELLDAGVDDLDAEVIAYHEETEVIDKISTGKYVAIQDDFIDIAKNGDCVQIFLHNRPFREVD